MISKLNPRLSDKDIFHIYRKLTNVSEDMSRDIDKYGEFKKPVAFKLGQIETEEGVRIKRSHYTTEMKKEFQYNNEDYTRVAIHGTSNIPNSLTNSQFKSLAMSSLMKNNAKNPGSIFTCGKYKFIQVDRKLLYIPN
jgi:hypothetical protein